MGSLTSCIKKAGPALAADDRAWIEDRARTLREGGAAPAAAAAQAVQERLQEARAQLQTLEPPAPPAPAPAPAADAGPLTEQDLNNLFDEAAADVRSEQAAAAAPAEPTIAEQAAAAAKAATERRAAARERERELYREIAGDAGMVGKSVEDVLAQVKARSGGLLTDKKADLLARAIHKDLARRAKELEKQKHRNPAVRAAAVAEAVAAKYPNADIPPEQHGAFLRGFDHALAGKTKSTLAGEHLPDALAGYEAARRWIEDSEEGAAWYEGRPVNKLQNTGMDLKRWFDALKAQMKEGESDLKKAWTQIERATARADLFRPLLPDGVTPGYQRWVEGLRENVATFKEWLENNDRKGLKFDWMGEYPMRATRYSEGWTFIKLVLQGSRYPGSLTKELRDKFQMDEGYRAEWLRTQAEAYIAEVRAFIEPFIGTSSVAEVAGKFTERFIVKDPEVGKGRWVSMDYTPAGEKFVKSPLFTGKQHDFREQRTNSGSTQHLIQNENRVAPTDRAKPLTPPRLDRVTRDGPSIRGEASVTPKEVKAKLGFADVGFGDWVGAKQDQDHLNYSHDAFVDLAKHWGLQDLKSIGFGGGMHFTIGALGRGKHAAHFHAAQPSPIGPVSVINVTNTQGDGTIAHEWMHALDHFLGGEWKNSVRPAFIRHLQRQPLTVERVESTARRFLLGHSYWRGDKKNPVKGAQYALSRADVLYVQSAYKSNADKLGKDYWGNDEELIARAAEAWVSDTLGFTNTYLVNPAWVGDGAVTQAKGYRGTPYPTGDERKVFNTMYAALAKAIKWKDGQPTVTRADFEAALPEEFFAGEKLAKKLREDAGAMQALKERFEQEILDAQSRREAEAAERARQEKEELDRMAEEELANLQPPPAPPVVDAPPVSEATGPLSESDLEALFDQAAAEVREAQQELPDLPEPGREALDPDRWTQADLDEMLAAQDQSGAGGIATAMKLPGFPTIHELGALGKTDHFGMGMFQTTGHMPGEDARTLGKEWRLTWDGGGAMRKTASGKAYTLVQVTGPRPFTMSLQEAMAAVKGSAGAMTQAERDAAAAGRAPAADEVPPPTGSAEDWWNKELTGAGRRLLMKDAGLNLPDRVYWHNMAADAQRLVLAAAAARRAPAAPKEAPPPSAANLIAEATKLGVKGADEALTGLAKLFGGKGKLNSFPSFDEKTYEEAKPHFQAALRAFQEAGKTLKDLFVMLVKQFGEGVKPYAVRFAQEQGLTNNLGETPPAPQYTPPALADTPAMALAKRVEVQFRSGEPFDWRTLFEWADAAYGGTQAEGKYTPKDAYDALEMGVNRYILAHPGTYTPQVNAEAAAVIVQDLANRIKALPTQTKRTAEQDSYQQFSTVPPFAFAATWVANVGPTDVMLEPSAGLGGIAVFAKNAGAKLVLNELAARRAALLQQVFPGSKVYTEDAEQIDNILPDTVRPTVVVMNPPFSSAAERGVAKDTAIGARHVEQALERLAPGGRLVAIVGEGMGWDRPAFRAWWRKISAKYAVRAVIPVDGSGYAKYGTTFDNALLVIDKVAPEPGAEPITAKADTYNDLIRLLAEVRDERPAADEPADDRGSAERDAAESALDEPGAATGARGAGDRPADGVGSGEPLPQPPGGRDGAGGGGQRSGRGPGGAARQPGRPEADAGQDAQGGVGDSGQPAGGVSGVQVETQAEPTKAGELSDSVFETYTPHWLRVPGAQPHPGALVESTAMASVPPPKPTYTPNLPKEMIEKGKVSLAQLEAVVYAGQAHEQVTETVVSDKDARDFNLKPGTPYRRGFFIGDGTGVGKGREIGAIVMDNLRQGRKKAVWISEKQDLISAARNDFAGIGGDPKLIFNQNDTKADGVIDAGKNGILFTTYATLRSSAQNSTAGGFKKGAPVVVQVKAVTYTPGDQGTATGKLVKIDAKNHKVTVEWPDGKKIEHPFAQVVSIAGDANFTTKVGDKSKGPRTRVQQLAEWLGPDFDGVIAFDEAHNANNVGGTKTERGEKDAAAQALAVLELQNRLPNARVVYVSATGATEVSNLAFATRLGLWGPGTPFASRDNFIASMQAGGLATMELVARDMKQMGAYLARGLSYDGVSYDRVEHKLTEVQVDIYNRLCDAWQVVLKNMEEAMKATGIMKDNGKAKARAASAAKSAFWGAQQRFFSQILTSMQMPTVIAQIERDLDAGDAVVLQLVNTNEAQQERALAKKKEEGDEDLEDLDLTPRDQLVQMVEKSFPVQQYQDEADEDGKIRAVPVFDSEGKPVLNKAAVAMRERLLEDIDPVRAQKVGKEAIAVPDGPLEIILNSFGPEVVAEVTGRKQRVVYKTNADGETVKTLEKRSDSSNRADSAAFMDDKKRILVFSDAGGTGFSFQADLSRKNQRVRSHHVVQAGWRANKCVQAMGRSHRSNQKQPPRYTLTSTNVPAHKRFLSSIARRLDQLGALTKGQRDTSSGGLFSEKDNLESKYATQAVKRLLEDARLGQIDGLNFNDLLGQMGLEDIVNQDTGLIAESKFPTTQQFLNRMLSIRLELQDKVFNAFIARMEEQIELADQRGELDTGMQTIRALESRALSEETIYVDPRTEAETKYIRLELKHPTRMYAFPDEEKVGSKIEWMVNLRSGRVWGRRRSGNQTLTNGAIVPRYYMAGTGGGKYLNELDFFDKESRAPRLPGSMDPKAWKEISEIEARERWAKETADRPTTYTTEAHMIVGAMLPIWDRLETAGILQVARTQTSDGRRLLGRKINEKDVAEIRRRLNLAAPEASLPPAEVLARLLKGEIGELANGWKLERAKVSDELRIELRPGRDLTDSEVGAMRSIGMIVERIVWKNRVFVPTSSPDVLAKLTKNRPLIGLKRPGGDDETPVLSRAPFYSALRDSVGRIPMNAAPAAGWKQSLKGLVSAGKVKADEVEWSGLNEWLDLQGAKVRKQDVLAFLDSNGVQVTETVLGGDAQAQADFEEARDEALRDLDRLGYEPAWLNEGTSIRGVVRMRDGREFDLTDGWEDGEGEAAMLRLDDILRTRDDNEYRVNDERKLPKYANYTLPGGTNYREVLLTLPTVPREAAPAALKTLPDGYEVIFDGQEPQGQQWGIVPPGQMHARPWAGRHADPEAARAAALSKLNAERLQRWKDAAPQYRSGHWDQPNILAHIRLNDRLAPRPGVDMAEIGERIRAAVGAKTQDGLGNGAPESAVRKGVITEQEGRWYAHHRGFMNVPTENPMQRVLFVEEIQSDWAQQGKKQGFGATTRWTVVDRRGPMGGFQRGDFATEAEALAYLDNNQLGLNRGNAHPKAVQGDGIPRAPFVESTDKWLTLALKRIVKMAVDEGYDRVAFINGEQSAQRYDLSKQIDKVEWNPKAKTLIAFKDGKVAVTEKNATEDRLPDLLGKEVAQRLVDAPLRNGSIKSVEGLALKVGGEGMRAFYDQIVPAATKALLKKLGGGQMTSVRIDVQGTAANGRALTATMAYEGPEYTSAQLVHSSTRARINEGPGSTAQMEQQFRDVANAIRGGDTFAQAMAWHASPALAEALGGKLVPLPEVIVEQPAFDITPAMRERAAGGLPLFRQGSGPSMKLEDLQALVAKVTKGWRADGPEVVAVQSTQDLPPNIKAMLATQGALDSARGLMMPDGRVFMVADNLGGEEEAQFVLFHETYGHWGLRSFLGSAYVDMMGNLRMANPKLAQEANAWYAAYGQKEVNARVKSGLSKEEAGRIVRALSVEEALADRAGSEGLPKGWKLVVAALQKALRRLGLARVADMIERLTEAETHALLMAARRELRGGKMHAFTGDATPALSRKRRYDELTESAMRDAGVGGPPTARDKLRSYWDAAVEAVRERNTLGNEFRQGALDQFHGIRLAERTYLGGDLTSDASGYIAARVANGGTSSVMRALMLHGQARWAANGQHLEKIPGTKGMLDILEPLGEDLNEFFGWMVGNRAARLKKEGRENLLTDEKIKALQGLANTPEKLEKFKAAAKEYASFKRSVLDIAEAAGLINPETRPAWDHADYIPFYREIDDRGAFSPTGKKGLHGQSSGIYVLKGGTKQINDPMENLLMNFSRLIDASLKNNALRKAVDSLVETDALNKVGYDVKGALVLARDVGEHLAKHGTPREILDTIPPEALEGIAKMWSIQAPQDKDVVRVMVGGKPRFYRVNDRLLLKALTSFETFDFPGLGLARMAKRILTRMVTVTPEFMVRNWVRDSIAVQAITPGFNPLKSLSGIRKSYSESGGFEAMLFAGASFQSGYVDAGDPEATGRHMRRALRKGGFKAVGSHGLTTVTLDSAIKAWDFYIRIGESIENANREAIYEATIKAGGSVTDAAYAAKDLMDFSLRGSWAAYQLLADVLPFFNARVQGLYRLGRSDPKRLVRVGLMLTLATMILSFINDGEDWYEALEDWRKDMYWHFRIGGLHVQLPKPFEVGLVFAIIPERIGRSIKGLDSGSKTMSVLWKNVTEQLMVMGQGVGPLWWMPPVQLIAPAANAAANYDPFRDRAIESIADERKSPSARYSGNTSATMVALATTFDGISDMTGLSPKRLEYLVNGYFGTVGMYALGLSDMLVRAAQDAPEYPAYRTDDIPLLRAFYVEDPARSTVFESDLYKMAREVEEIWAEARSLATDNKGAEALAKLAEDPKKAQVRGIVVGATNQLRALNNERDRIYASRTMSREEKREALDELQVRKNLIARTAATDPRVREAFR